MKFQDDISNMNTYIHTYIHTYVHTYGQAETNMPPHFFKVGGIMMASLKVDSTEFFSKRDTAGWRCNSKESEPI